jgi:TonB family protein
VADRTDSAGAVRAPAALDTGRTQPLPVRRASPLFTREVLDEMRRAQGKVTISVLASIDANGSVRSAKVVSATGEPSPSGSYLRQASLNAARQWKFRPATVEGKAIASELTLVFTF